MWCLRVRSDVGVYGVRFLGFSILFTTVICSDVRIVYALDYYLGGGGWCLRVRFVVGVYGVKFLGLSVLFTIVICSDVRVVYA